MEINADVFFDYSVFETTGVKVPTFAKVETLISQHFETKEEAETFAALWPKGLKMHAYLCGWTGSQERGKTYGVAMRHVTLGTNGVNGGKNETGIKRLVQFAKAAAKLGVTVTSSSNARNRFDTFTEGLQEATK